MRLSSTCSLFTAGLVAALAGCPNREVSEVNPNQDKVEQKEIPLTINRDIDILFVIDNSGSMKEEQDTLVENFPTFISVLEQIEGGLPNVHLGVISSDMGTLGVNTGDAACGSSDQGNLQSSAAITGNFISDVDPDGAGPNPRVFNYSGTLAAAFTSIASLGTGGCGFEQHLESMKAALNNNPVNNTFLRSGAYLAVVIIADEDDCSAAQTNFFGPESPQLGPLDSFRCFEKAVACNEGRDTELRDVGVKTGCALDDTQNYLHKVQEYVDFLKGLKPDDRDVIVGGIIGPTEPVEVGRRTPPMQTTPRPDVIPSCSYCEVPLDGTGNCPDPTNNLSTADPGFRLRAFFESFVDRNTFTTICDDDYTDALNQIAELLRTVIGYPCIEADLSDSDPATPGVQYECQFSYVTNPGEPDEVEQALAECDASIGNKPCWHLVEDLLNCTTSSHHLSVAVERDVEPAPNTYIKGGCVVN